MTSIGRPGPHVPAHAATTRNLGAAYPLLAEPGLGSRGVLIGQDLLGGTFVYDPFELYNQGALSNPNMIVFGQLGRGKSAFIKSYLWRQAVFGRKAWIVDPKGEYAALASAWGMAPVSLRPGGPVRLNPLDPEGPGAIAGQPRCQDKARDLQDEGGVVTISWAANRRQLELLASLACSCMGRDLRPRERVAIELALGSVQSDGDVITLPKVVDALLAPTGDAAAQVQTSRATLLEDGRDVALELRRLVHGDLRGMFDGPTSSGLDLSGSLVVLDLSALYNSAALGILMACATAWLQGSLAKVNRGATGEKVFVVVDEAWAILANLAVARWLQASWKLSRAHGVANVAVLHRLSDLQAVGGAGSEQVSLARGLLADSETRVVYGQSPGEVRRATELLNLSPTEAQLLPRLRRGVALWKVGRRGFLVQHVLGHGEREIVDTDAAMREIRA